MDEHKQEGTTDKVLIESQTDELKQDRPTVGQRLIHELQQMQIVRGGTLVFPSDGALVTLLKQWTPPQMQGCTSEDMTALSIGQRLCYAVQEAGYSYVLMEITPDATLRDRVRAVGVSDDKLVFLVLQAPPHPASS